MDKKNICVVTPCYNEEANVVPLYEAVKKEFEKLPGYTYSHLFIDNDSKDKTPILLEGLAAKDKNVKVILNTRNFGHLRSPFHGLMSAPGDAVISLVADFQDPPEMIPMLLNKWKEGNKSVKGWVSILPPKISLWEGLGRERDSRGTTQLKLLNKKSCCDDNRMKASLTLRYGLKIQDDTFAW